MSNVIKKTKNTFQKGLLMDFSPENTGNEVLTHALNATLLTFNGNELSLQNDMGNGRVETAYLPEGYIPVGTCEYGGIIYIVSYNPLEDKSQIGCFPSPERNISHDELGDLNQSLETSSFQELDSSDNPTGKLKNTIQHVVLKQDKLNPGDKYIVCANEDIYGEKLVGLETFDTNTNDFKPEQHPILSLRIVSIEESGKIVDLDSTVRMYEKTVNSTPYRYSILGTDLTNQVSTQPKDIDEYRNTLSSGYNVFRSKISGKLALLAELIMIDSFSVTYSLEEKFQDENQNPINNTYSITLHPEISTDESTAKYSINPPELKYYYLEESQARITLNNNVNLPQNSNINTNSDNTLAFFVDGSDIKNLPLENLYDIQSLPSGLSSTDPFSTLTDRLEFADVNTYHENNGVYTSVSIGDVQLPTYNNIDFPLNLKYKYKIVPCMNYGRLDHLAVSNEINFSNLKNFDSSNFNIWKYRVDSNQVRLTFGAVVNEMSEHYKVDGIVLEFYDLWGFAGSLTFENKKSYSGEFTKIIPLNTLDALSKDKIHCTTQTSKGYLGNIHSDFARNVNICRITDTKHKYYDKLVHNNERVAFDRGDLNNPPKGWMYTTGDNSGKCVPSDTGILYQNLIYGVKMYLRRDINGDKEYILKDTGFLFTSTLFNDYYYSVSNFNTQIQDPKLDFVLTYKLYDNSTISPFEDTNTNIIDGYPSDSPLPTYSTSKEFKTNIEGIRYYKYTGTSNLHVEIGLKQDYENALLSCDPSINDQFECTLHLYSDEFIANNLQGTYPSYCVNSNKTTNDIAALNYPGVQDWNKFYFKIGDTEMSDLTINAGEFQQYNFTKKEGGSIPIVYQFVVGHKVFINDIKYVEVPVTTVCALCHQQDDDSYNYADFGIYEVEKDDGTSQYLSDTVFYNSGTTHKSRFGVARQVDTSAATTIEQCMDVHSIESDAVKLTTAFKLNTGKPLKEMLPYVGKLAFCTPHLSGFTETGGVNVSNLKINPYINTGGYKFGAMPNPGLYNNPRYLLSPNTKKSIDLQQEFIVNMDYTVAFAEADDKIIITEYDIKKNEATQHYDQDTNVVEYKGYTGSQLASFNKYLLTTMKDIYAYNPDYDVQRLQQGDISTEDLQIRFTSNLISSNADLKLTKPLNEQLFIGTMYMSDYLESLETYSDDISYVNQKIMCKNGNGWESPVNFQPNLYYCGQNQNLLLTQLTYNTPVPSNLSADLNLTDPDLIFVRHSDRSVTKLKGVLNKNKLYGFKENTKQLVELDVSNCAIGQDGKLSFIDPIYRQNYGAAVWNKTATITPAGINTQSQIRTSIHYRNNSGNGGNFNTYIIDPKKEKRIAILIPIDKDLSTGDPELRFDNRFDFYVDGQNGATIKNVRIKLNLWIYLTRNNMLSKQASAVQYNLDSQEFDDIWNTFTKGQNYLKDINGKVIEGLSDLYYLSDKSALGFVIYNASTDSPFNTEWYSFAAPEKGKPYNPEHVNITLTSVANPYGTLRIHPTLKPEHINNNSLLVLAELEAVEISSTHNLKLDTSTSIVATERIWPQHYYYNSEYYDGVTMYEVLPEYSRAKFVGTSVTISDLVYSPNKTGHRLYMRNSCGKYTIKHDDDAKVCLSGRLFYREYDEPDLSFSSDTYKRNRLLVTTGPSFEPVNFY